MWSVDHTLLNISDSKGGYEPSEFLGFDVTGLACGRLYKNNPSYSNTGGLRVGNTQFSPTNPRWDYTRVGNLSAEISIIDLTNYQDQDGAPTITPVLDFSKCYTPGYATGGRAGHISYSEFGGVALDNTTTGVAVMAFSNTGGQDSGYLLCSAVFNPGAILAGTSSLNDDVYYTYDLFAGQVYQTVWDGSGWIQTNIGAITGEHPAIHNHRINRNGEFIEVTRSGLCNGTCTSTYYNMTVGGTTLWRCSTCSGHEAQGYASMIGAGGLRTFLYGETDPTPVNISDIAPRRGDGFPYCRGSWVQPTLAFSNAPCQDPVTDSHISSDMDTDGTDTAGIGWVSTTVGGPRPPNIESGIGPWRNEVIIIDPTSGAIHREGHTFNSTMSLSFSLQNTIGVISADGCCFAVSTDWYGAFGKQDSTGTNACTSAVDYYRPSWIWGPDINVLPTSNNPGHYVYNTGAGGTGSSTKPTFNQTVGGTTTDGRVTWTNRGLPNCRGDVVIYNNR
jgi:hypothetical protein